MVVLFVHYQNVFHFHISEISNIRRKYMLKTGRLNLFVLIMVLVVGLLSIGCKRPQLNVDVVPNQQSEQNLGQSFAQEPVVTKQQSTGNVSVTVNGQAQETQTQQNQQISGNDTVVVFRVPPADDINARTKWADWHDKGVIQCLGSPIGMQDRYLIAGLDIQLWRLVDVERHQTNIWTDLVGGNKCNVWLGELDRIPGAPFNLLIATFPIIAGSELQRDFPLPNPNSAALCRAAYQRTGVFCKVWEGGGAQLSRGDEIYTRDANPQLQGQTQLIFNAPDYSQTGILTTEQMNAR